MRENTTAYPNCVVRQARDRGGVVMGLFVERHDGTEAGILEAAQRLANRLFEDFPDACNVNSLAVATDENGRAIWEVAQSCQRLTRVNIDGAETQRQDGQSK